MQNECTLSLSLFGAPSLQLVQGGEVVGPVRLCTQSRNLLAYLALARGAPRSRTELSLALRDDGDEPARPGAVNSALWRLRSALEAPPCGAGGLIFKERDGQVGLRADPRLAIDIEAFLQHVLPVLAIPLERVDATAAEQLRLGVALYTGDLLPGVHEDWVLREREKLRRHQLNALWRLVEVCERSGDAVGAIRWAEGILEIDDVREDVHRELMCLYLRAGQRALALRQYERCRAILRRQLAIVPMPETQALYREIVDAAVVRPASEGRREPAGAAPADGALPQLLASARRHIAAADDDLSRAQARPDGAAPS
jgi:DNA-binding SARP family transcriptional activator